MSRGAALTHYRARAPQGLRNVFMPSATLIRVDQGEKALWWQERTYRVDRSHWLAVPAGSHLTFTNQPGGALFASRALSLFQPPPARWLGEPASRRPPLLPVTPSLAWCFERVAESTQLSLSADASHAIIEALYGELHAAGALTLLFPATTRPLSQRLTDLLIDEPGAEHTLASLAPRLAMSRATLTRHLAAEAVSFGELLTRVRMTHALTLLQQATPLPEVALACGYQSVRRFTARFRTHFGLSPGDYRQTCE
ncbi:hypothetical protein ATO46_02215 [Aeromonas schubertii]|uniref:helix-turn-helix transcriptional regulator n=1 Tax=Aeromonas TaxID=642 RepID=UPI00067E900B|nr:AraC family transcriptional regulator [Aeromonas schubertii]KUE81764.1 hypothetical protein ATO46_02215 [Aeromonas schubertii]MBZ6071530.1 AraC family transcriptional regulator [Aeromonas schubertii]